VTDGLPAQDMMKVKRFLRRYPREKKMRLIGPNCAGIISPGKGFMGIMPPHIYTPGRVGIVGRSGTLGYEAASQMSALGDRRVVLHRDRRRPDQRLLLPRYPGAVRERSRDRRRHDDRRDRRPAGGGGGGICPRSHDQAGGGLCRGPVAPKGRKMGHAGAIISAFGESAQEKVVILQEAGITVAPNPSMMGETVARILNMQEAA
jgi:malate-CoA ligase subunit alpha